MCCDVLSGHPGVYCAVLSGPPGSSCAVCALWASKDLPCCALWASLVHCSVLFGPPHVNHPKCQEALDLDHLQQNVQKPTRLMIHLLRQRLFYELETFSHNGSAESDHRAGLSPTAAEVHRAVLTALSSLPRFESQQAKPPRTTAAPIGDS